MRPPCTKSRTGFPDTPPDRRDPAELPGLFVLARDHTADELGPAGGEAKA